MIDFSIIIPVYNVEPYIGAAIESVLRQKYESMELILVDDASTDGSGAICDGYAARDQRVTVVHKEKNGYVGAARNTGLSLAKGDYVYFLDADDCMSGCVLTRVKRILSARPDVVSSLKHCTKKANGNIKTNRARTEGIPLKTALAAFSPFVGQHFYRRAFLLENNKPFEERRMLAEDRKWLVENLALARNIHAEDYPFYYYTQRREGSLLNLIHADSLSFSLEQMKNLYDGVDRMSYTRNARLKRKLAAHNLALAACAAAVREDGLREELLRQEEGDLRILKSRDCLAHGFMWMRHIIGLKNLLRLCNLVFLRYRTDK